MLNHIILFWHVHKVYNFIGSKIKSNFTWNKMIKIWGSNFGKQKNLGISGMFYKKNEWKTIVFFLDSLELFKKKLKWNFDKSKNKSK